MELGLISPVVSIFICIYICICTCICTCTCICILSCIFTLHSFQYYLAHLWTDFPFFSCSQIAEQPNISQIEIFGTGIRCKCHMKVFKKISYVTDHICYHLVGIIILSLWFFFVDNLDLDKCELSSKFAGRLC